MMFDVICGRRHKGFLKSVSFFITASFIFTSVIGPQAFASPITLPAPTDIVPLSQNYSFPVLKGLKFDPSNPFNIEFIIDTADQRKVTEEEASTLIKYFLAGLTIPEKDVWVNLSPYEQGKIINDKVGETDLGSDLLSQDYILKQLSSSLTYPESESGKDYWTKVYSKVVEIAHTTNLPVNTFNKVWITPDKAEVYENGNSVFITEATLKTIMEEDYLALKENVSDIQSQSTLKEDLINQINKVSSSVMRDLILPKINQEVNTGKNFATLRQIYHSLILGIWFKQKFQDSIYKAYINQAKTTGIDVNDPNAKDKVYNLYVEAFQKGVYNYIKQDTEPVTNKKIKRQYISGGFTLLPPLPNGQASSSLTITHASPQRYETIVQSILQGTISGGRRGASLSVTLSPIGNDIAGLGGIASSPMRVATRIKQIDRLLPLINQAIVDQTKASLLPMDVVISDTHGEIRAFMDFVADAISLKIGKTVTLNHQNFPAVSIKQQLLNQGVDITAMTGLKFMLLGDFLDRGSFGIKCFRAAEELMSLRKAEYISDIPDEADLMDAPDIANYTTGNHDLWAFLNVMAFHLPVYKGYNFYGNTASEKLVNDHWDDVAIAQDRASWWTAKLADYNKAQDTLQKGSLRIAGQDIEQDVEIKKIREELKGIFLQIENQLSSAEQDVWKDLVGWYFGNTDVYTGFNGIGKMSAKWWQDRLDKIQAFQDKETNDNARSIRNKLLVYTKAATNVVNQRLNDSLRDGQWWWQVFNDINHQNYTSVEWWGQDWSSHKGWGTSVIEELNKLDGDKKWNQANYINNPHLKDLAGFYRKNFTLFLKDSYGNYYTHGFLPIEKDGNVRFTYKGKNYEGKTVWDGLEALQNDIRDMSKPLSELHEALNLVNSWYADKTTRIKPANIKKYVNEIGLDKIFENLGIRTWVMGHNPINTMIEKAGIGFITQQGDYTLVITDNGMSEKFNGYGGYADVGPGGIKMRGYNDLSFSTIVDNPDIVKLKKDEKTGERFIVKAWESGSIAPADFLSLAKKQMETERTGLSAAQQAVAPGVSSPMNAQDMASLKKEIRKTLEPYANRDPKEYDVFVSQKTIDNIDKDPLASVGVIIDLMEEGIDRANRLEMSLPPKASYQRSFRAGVDSELAYWRGIYSELLKARAGSSPIMASSPMLATDQAVSRVQQKLRDGSLWGSMIEGEGDIIQLYQLDGRDEGSVAGYVTIAGLVPGIREGKIVVQEHPAIAGSLNFWVPYEYKDEFKVPLDELLDNLFEGQRPPRSVLRKATIEIEKKVNYKYTDETEFNRELKKVVEGLRNKQAREFYSRHLADFVIWHDVKNTDTFGISTLIDDIALLEFHNHAGQDYAKKFKEMLREVANKTREEQLDHLKTLLQSPDFAIDIASWLEGAYYRGIGQNAPPFITKDMAPEQIKEKIAINLAGFYALETGVGLISERTGLKPTAILDSIIDGSLPQDHKLVLSRFANATWKAGQPFRDLKRISRPNFVPAAQLPNNELDKDIVQIREAAIKVRDAMSLLAKGIDAGQLLPGRTSSPVMPGGIDLNGINVKTAPSSTPIAIPAIDIDDFQGLTFTIVKLEEIKEAQQLALAR